MITFRVRFFHYLAILGIATVVLFFVVIFFVIPLEEGGLCVTGSHLECFGDECYCVPDEDYIVPYPKEY